MFVMSFKLLANIYKPRVAYFLLSPAELAEASGRRRRRDSAAMAAMVEGFISAYGGEDGPTMGPWVQGDWEYYEVPLEEVRGIRGLRPLIRAIERFRRTKVEEGVVDYEAVGNPDKYSTRHRFMSWRFIGGMRRPEGPEAGGSGRHLGRHFS